MPKATEARRLHLPDRNSTLVPITGGTIAGLQDEVIRFRDARAWKQFHDPKDVAISLSLEAAELLEKFQWRSGSEALLHDRAGIEDELADVLYWTLLLAHDLGVDLDAATRRKLAENAKKYPVEKAAGSRLKYTEL